jgi:hypothetical protein
MILWESKSMNVKRRLLPLVLTLIAICSAGSPAVAERPVKDGPVAEKVAGGPIPGAPRHDLREGVVADQWSVQGVYLPFNFSFSFTRSLSSRVFWPSSSGRACVNLRGTGSAEPTWWGREIKVEMWNAYGTDTKVGATVRYSADGTYYGYCWTGLYPYHEHYFRVVKDWSTTRAVWGDGWVSP